jgi:hypothetical protein
MSFLETFEAPVIATFTDNISRFLGGILSCIGTIWSWTPFGLFIDINERFLEIVKIFGVG